MSLYLINIQDLGLFLGNNADMPTFFLLKICANADI